MTEKNNEFDPLQPDENLKLNIENALDDIEKLAKDDNADLKTVKRKVQELKDGVQVLKGDMNEDEEENIEKEPLTLKEKKRLVEFVHNIKNPTEKDLNSLTDEEIDELLRISFIKSKHFNYHPKIHFGMDYKKKRQQKNKVAKKSRKINRK